MSTARGEIQRRFLKQCKEAGLIPAEIAIAEEIRILEDERGAATDPPDDAFEKVVYQAFNSARDLLLRKHQDYGPKNISNAPGGPLNGLRVRMYDKLARINNLVESGAEPENESLRDSFMDLANYGIIGLLVLDGHWPGVPE